VIRKATAADAPALVVMTGHFIEGTSYARFFRFRPRIIGDLVDRCLEVGLVLVAEQDGLVVGMLAAFPLVEPIGQQPMLDELCWWVEPSYRNGSIGPRLLKAAEAWARQKQLQLVKMVEPADQPQVGAYYARLGYTKAETSWVKRLPRLP
jgi:GNAT superfamily N-acetyltransferase